MHTVLAETDLCFVCLTNILLFIRKNRFRYHREKSSDKIIGFLEIIKIFAVIKQSYK